MGNPQTNCSCLRCGNPSPDGGLHPQFASSEMCQSNKDAPTYWVHIQLSTTDEEGKKVWEGKCICWDCVKELFDFKIKEK